MKKQKHYYVSDNIFFKLKIKAIREAGSLWNDPQGKFVII